MAKGKNILGSINYIMSQIYLNINNKFRPYDIEAVNKLLLSNQVNQQPLQLVCANWEALSSESFKSLGVSTQRSCLVRSKEQMKINSD